MHLRSITAITTLARATIRSSGVAGTVPSAIPAPSESAAACTILDQIPPSMSYSHEIGDARTLAFISYVEALPAAKHGEVLKRAVVGLPRSAAAEIDAKTDDVCKATEISYRVTRFVHDLAALFIESISQQTRDSVLTSCEIDSKALDGLVTAASRPASGGCSMPATATATTQPDYPVLAQAQRAQGNISTAVSLNDHGFVESVRLYRNGAPANDCRSSKRRSWMRDPVRTALNFMIANPEPAPMSSAPISA